MSASEEALDRVYARIARDLSYRYGGVFTFETVAQVVARVRADLDDRSRIRDFLPVLAENLAREELRTAARVPDFAPGSALDVLFVSAGSGRRARLAAGLAEDLTGPRTCVRSAGHDLTELSVRAADVVVTVGGGISCPLLPGKWYQDWDVLDPAGEDADTVLAVRADLQTRVSSLVSSLGL